MKKLHYIFLTFLIILSSCANHYEDGELLFNKGVSEKSKDILKDAILELELIRDHEENYDNAQKLILKIDSTILNWELKEKAEKKAEKEKAEKEKKEKKLKKNLVNRKTGFLTGYANVKVYFYNQGKCTFKFDIPLSIGRSCNLQATYIIDGEEIKITKIDYSDCVGKGLYNPQHASQTDWEKYNGTWIKKSWGSIKKIKAEKKIKMCEYCPNIPAEDGSSMCSSCISEEDEMDGMGPDQSDMGSSENSWDLYASLKKYRENIFECKTDNFRIRIDWVDYFIDSNKKEYRYASWPINESHDQEPALVLYKGKLILTPNGKKYEFQNGLYKYTCIVINQEPIELVVYKNEQELRREKF